jgi:hypothetical protein
MPVEIALGEEPRDIEPGRVFERCKLLVVACDVGVSII